MANANDKIEKVEIEVEVDCPADKFYDLFKHNVTHIQHSLPHTYESIQVIEGDGLHVGSVRLWNFTLDGKPCTAKDRMMAVDDETRSITYNVFEGDLVNDYKHFDIKLVITPKGDGSDEGCMVKWTLEFEKAQDDSPLPTAFLNFLDVVTKELDPHLHNKAA